MFKIFLQNLTQTTHNFKSQTHAVKATACVKNLLISSANNIQRRHFLFSSTNRNHHLAFPYQHSKSDYLKESSTSLRLNSSGIIISLDSIGRRSVISNSIRRNFHQTVAFLTYRENTHETKQPVEKQSLKTSNFKKSDSSSFGDWDENQYQEM